MLRSLFPTKHTNDRATTENRLTSIIPIGIEKCWYDKEAIKIRQLADVGPEPVGSLNHRQFANLVSQACGAH